MRICVHVYVCICVYVFLVFIFVCSYLCSSWIQTLVWNPRIEILCEYFAKRFVTMEVTINLPFGFPIKNMISLNVYIHTYIRACMHTNFHACIIHTYVPYVVCMCSYVSMQHWLIIDFIISPKLISYDSLMLLLLLHTKNHETALL